MHSSNTRSLLAALSVAFGAILWGVVWYPMRLLEARGLQGVWLTLILFAVVLVVSLPWGRRVVAQLQQAPGWFFVLTIASGWTNVAFVEAILDGNVLRVLLLFYLSPLWATLMGRVVLGEPVSRRAAVSLGIALAGALLMLWNPDFGAPWPQGRADWLALSSGFAFALSNVATRRLQQATVATKVFCVGFGVTATAAILLMLYDVPAPAVAPVVIGGAIALGLFGILAMTLLVQYGVSHIPVYRSAVITFVELVAGAVSQALLTDEVVSAREWIGGALIVAGAYFAARVAARR